MENDRYFICHILLINALLDNYCISVIEDESFLMIPLLTGEKAWCHYLIPFIIEINRIIVYTLCYNSQLCHKSF